MIEKMKLHSLCLVTLIVILGFQTSWVPVYSHNLQAPALSVIPYPKQVSPAGKAFAFKEEVTVVLDKNASVADRFAATELVRELKDKWNIQAKEGIQGEGQAIILTRQKVPKILRAQGYQVITGENSVLVRAPDEAGLFYGTQTLLQLIERESQGLRIPGVSITDWPDIGKRAIHYDTKHHQDKADYVREFIKDLARYKVNMLVWEWEDKFAYPSHPEIGAPGAFTMKEMQEFTRFARQYHIQIVPLVQGLGHVSFILKWPQYKTLREIPSSNWEFCPLNEGSYQLLSDLWKDAMEATPGSEYLHIGSDETYELAACDACKAKAGEIGKSGLYQLFINKSAAIVASARRKTMAWEAPMGWKFGESPAKGIEPFKGLALTESYDYETPQLGYAKEARTLGFEVFAYDPNPGVVPLMVPYIFEQGEKNEPRTGSLEKSHLFLTHAAKSGVFNGMICTSWDDDGLHNQMWMMHFVNAAACSWNGEKTDPKTFRESFYRSYYGSSAVQMDSLFNLLNQGAYYYAGTMERNVWHYGEIGQTHLPDMPRGDALEYDPFWNTQYKEKVSQSKIMLEKMDKALAHVEQNKKAGVSHPYDFEIFRTTAALIRHTCLIYTDLSSLEYTIREAHVSRFTDANASLELLVKAQLLLENSLARRESVYNDLVKTYEITRLPKGMDGEKKFFWQQDRARHFAFRRPDMSYLIYDEQLLDMEGYLVKLKDYIAWFRDNSMN